MSLYGCIVVRHASILVLVPGAYTAGTQYGYQPACTTVSRSRKTRCSCPSATVLEPLRRGCYHYVPCISPLRLRTGCSIQSLPTTHLYVPKHGQLWTRFGEPCKPYPMLSVRPSGNNSEKSDLVQKIVIAVSRDLTDSRTLSDWARHLDVDPGKLHKFFVRATGQTFPRWRNSVRISLARQLLEGPMTPSEVARRVGYAHASSFTQAFSKTYGIPPSAYQQRGIQIGSNSAIDGRQMCIS